MHALLVQPVTQRLGRLPIRDRAKGDVRDERQIQPQLRRQQAGIEPIVKEGDRAEPLIRNQKDVSIVVQVIAALHRVPAGEIDGAGPFGNRSHMGDVGCRVDILDSEDQRHMGFDHVPKGQVMGLAKILDRPAIHRRQLGKAECIERVAQSTSW